VGGKVLFSSLRIPLLADFPLSREDCQRGALDIEQKNYHPRSDGEAFFREFNSQLIVEKFKKESEVEKISIFSCFVEFSCILFDGCVLA